MADREQTAGPSPSHSPPDSPRSGRSDTAPGSPSDEPTNHRFSRAPIRSLYESQSQDCHQVLQPENHVETEDDNVEPTSSAISDSQRMPPPATPVRSRNGPGPAPAKDAGPAEKADEPPMNGNVAACGDSLIAREAGVVMDGEHGPAGPGDDEALNDEVAEDDDVNDEDMESEFDDDPQEELDRFDWAGLERKYHEMIKQKDDELLQLGQQYADLQHFFALWCSMIGQRESGLLYHRHKTQQTYVRFGEESLEQERLFYVDVVSRFRAAMDMMMG